MAPSTEQEPEPELDPMADSSETKKKKKKKSKKKKKDHFPVTVTVSPLFSGADASSSLPAVGYFPSGYDPTARDTRPTVRMFRHKEHAQRMDLVVSDSNGPEFVGRSYAGEAAAWPRLCDYAVAVFDKSAGTFKVAPVAANRIFRLEPQIEVKGLAQAEPSEGLTEELQNPAKPERKFRDLTIQFGAMKDRQRDKKWLTMKEQRDDPSAFEPMELENAEPKIDGDSTAMVQEPPPRNIPPHNPSADSPEDVYLFDEIIPARERSYLLDILEDIKDKSYLPGYPNFVNNRLEKLQRIKNEEEKEKLACILSYITHLITFREQCEEGVYGRPSRSAKHSNRSKDRPKIPHVIVEKLRRLFLDSQTRLISTEKNELMLGYILVLTLFADGFRSEVTDICDDLRMTREIAKPFYQHLGCALVSQGINKPQVATLPVPLSFPDLTKKRRRPPRG